MGQVSALCWRHPAGAALLAPVAAACRRRRLPAPCTGPTPPCVRCGCDARPAPGSRFLSLALWSALCCFLPEAVGEPRGPAVVLVLVVAVQPPRGPVLVMVAVLVVVAQPSRAQV